MSTVQWLYLIGAPPAFAFPIYYWITARWWESKEGRLFMLMSSLPFFLYLSPVVFLLIPADPARDALRIFIGLLTATISYTTILVYRRVRRDARAAKASMINEGGEKNATR